MQDIQFVEYIVKQIVEQPEEIKIERTVDEMGVLITLKVAKEDMGKIIGKNGQTAKSIRILLRVIGSKNNARVNLKIVEPDGEEVKVDGEDL
ncbi:KH domain-containing protein [Candidatus Peregrinibacteria bacterium]|nr:KH domain-containing protein [Candidatus Peregrinibacteria bacterium]